eukprot:SAG22_NODE_142_length_17922_cov_10.990406_5_plen_153_part_00
MRALCRLAEGPRQTLAGQYTRGGQDVGGVNDGDNSNDALEDAAAAGSGCLLLPHAAMPNHVECVVRAGTALVMDTSIWHTSLPNTSPEDRRGVIIGYRSSETRAAGHACGLSEETVLRLDREGKLPPARRMLMGLGTAATGLPPINPAKHHI